MRSIGYTKALCARNFNLSYLAVSVLTIIVAIFFSSVGVAEDSPSYNLLDALDIGAFNIGSGQGRVTSSLDEAIDKYVLKFDYSIPKGSIVGVWSKSYPSGLGSNTADAVKIGVKVPNSEYVNQISVKVEIKGKKAVQNIPLILKPGWNSLQEAIDWELIGDLKEVVFVTSPIGEGESFAGTLYFDLDFYKSAPIEKNSVAAAVSSSSKKNNVSVVIPSSDSRNLDSIAQKASNIAPAKSDVNRSFTILDAMEIGPFNIGPAQCRVISSLDEAIDKYVLKFDYSIPKGSIVGVWSKSYPSDLGSNTADAVKIGVKVPNPDYVNQISVKVEIKGKKAVQNIPLILKPGWNSVQETINWGTIGDLKEVVFVVSPIGVGPTEVNLMGGSPIEVGRMQESEPVRGELCFGLEFSKLTFLQKNFTLVKVGLVFLISILVALIMVLLSRLFSQHHASNKFKSPDSSQASILSRLKRDLLYGMTAVLIGVVALNIYSKGMMSCLDTGFDFSFLALALIGAVIAEILKLALTGKHLTPAEVFQNILFTGLVAASSSRQELWQAPATWTEILTISNITATLLFLIYHISNAYSLASSGKHLRAFTGTLIIGTPYLFGWLLLLQNVNLLKALANGVTVGFLAAWPAVLEVIGRLLVVFVFNEVVTNAISLAIKGKMLKTPKVHIFILFVSLGVVVAPLIADLGSAAAVASLPIMIRAIVAILTAMFSFAGLWGEVYLITGIFLDSGKRTAPSWETIYEHVIKGMKKGMAYIGILMALLYILYMLSSVAVVQTIMSSLPLVVGILCGALVFPLLKTIIETFDGSLSFFDRVRYSYRDRVLYARGAVVGFGFAYMVSKGMFQQAMPERIMFGLIVGFFASAGVSILRDAAYAFKGQGRLQSWRLYFTDALLGVFVGSAAAFYLDSLQVPVIVEKFKLYTSVGFSAKDYITYPLVNKWGRLDLGSYTGGTKLIFTESLAGVINWAIAAWLFAINKVFLQAYFEKHTAPIKFFFSKAGFAQLTEHMIYVLRWGLWMSPIIFTFLRMMPSSTWYNQDGAIRTLFAIYHNITMSPEAFQAWSLKIFIYVLAFDFFRVLIWMDHMGLRVATLVNLSFIGLDRLDERIARFIGPAVAQRYIPEAVKRFCTWGPLLIPFYLPRGKDWDYAWSTSEAMQNAARRGGIIPALQSLTLPQMLLLIGLAILLFTGISFVVRLLIRRFRCRHEKVYELGNREYKVVLKENGEVYSEVNHQKRWVFPLEYDISRRSYDIIDPCGRILYLVDTYQDVDSLTRSWPIVGNFPRDRFETSHIEKDDNSLKVVNTANRIRTTIDIRLPDEDVPVELWTVTIENLTNMVRKLKLVFYLEWVLNGGLHDRFHTQYARLFPEMEYLSEVNAILAWQKSTKSMGILAADIPPEGFLTSRMDFIGRAQSIWKPRVLETLNFSDARGTARYPTFDPIGSLMIDAALNPKDSKTIRLMIGYATNRETAVDLINEYLKPQAAKAVFFKTVKKKSPLIGHGEILPGTPQPYSEYIDNGNKLLVHTPFTPRPYDHAMSNAVHSVMVTNRGLHTSCNGNSQQNRLTPDWPDTVTKEVSSEAIYLYDPDRNEWYSPTYHPLNDKSVKNTCEFGVDGTAVFRMSHKTVSTELTVFVPPDDPMGVYLLTVKNNADYPRRMRVAPYFQMVLEFQPEKSGQLIVRYDRAANALFFENPRNMFRTGWAFASMTIPAERVETKRGRFLGKGRGIAHPFMVEKGESDTTGLADDRQIAGFLGTLEIPAHGECTVAIILGQSESQKEARSIVRKYNNIEAVQKSLQDTRQWWLSLMKTVGTETNQPEFDRLQNWLKYQTLAERVWARRGFYQTSGAYGFRDQLQDAVNLIWVDPALARKQIILHASHQFIEGDVFHWFFTRTDGRTAFSCRSHASDNPLWLAWGVVEYINATSDYSILDEMTSYALSEFPFADLPKNKQGWGHLYHRSTRADSIYRHCLKSIDLVLEKRMGRHGLPLIRTGDWNDGLDEIGSEGRGESVWLGFFFYYIMKDMINIVEKKEGLSRKEHYLKKMQALKDALELTWRNDRYLRAIHDDGTEIGIKDSGIWEIDALTAAWSVMCGINPERETIMFNTAISILEKDNAVLLGWPALCEDCKPYLGRSCKYPEGVRENGMYCHGTQWLIKAARILSERFGNQGDDAKANEYRATAYRLWLKITPISHVTRDQIEIYGGQPNKQPADILTNFDQGRMIWHGYTGAAGWLLRQAYDSIVGASLVDNKLVLPSDLNKPRGELKVLRVYRDVEKSPLKNGI